MVVKLIVTSDVPNNALLTVCTVYEKLNNILSSDSPPRCMRQIKHFT